MITTEWRINKLSTGIYELRPVGANEALRTWTSYPSEEQIEAALAMARLLR